MTDAQWQDHSGLIITGIKILPAVDREGGRGLVLHLELESPSGGESRNTRWGTKR